LVGHGLQAVPRRASPCLAERAGLPSGPV